MSNNNQNEQTPLLSNTSSPTSEHKRSNSSNFYFLNKPGSHLKNHERNNTDVDITYEAVESETTSGGSEGASKSTNTSANVSVITGTDLEGGGVTEEVLNVMPSGTIKEQFSSRPVIQNLPPTNGGTKSKPPPSNLFTSILRGSSTKSTPITNNKTPPMPSPSPSNKAPPLMKPRSVPIKVEPKVFFANERTFLAWMHASVLLAGASIAIIAFADANPWSQLYGIMLLPVAICFVVYALYQYMRRAAMIRRRLPGPYEDLVGPTVLAVMLMVSIVGNFAIKLYSVMT